MRYRLKYAIINFLLFLGLVVMAIFMFLVLFTGKAHAYEWPKVVGITSAFCGTAEDATSILAEQEKTDYMTAHKLYEDLAEQNKCYAGEIVFVVQREAAVFRSLTFGTRIVDAYVLQGVTPEGVTVYVLVMIPLQRHDT